MLILKHISMPLLASLLCLLCLQTPLDANEGTIEETLDLKSYRRETPSGQYVDPASFFRFHGYVTLTYADPEEDLGGQILLPGKSGEVGGKNEGGFKNDSALFVGGEPFDGVGSVIELHFVGNAFDPVITEAKIIWDLMPEEGQAYTARIVAGRFWWPFGIHNDEWFSAVNQFNVISPAAVQVLPAHYNEVGMMLEGELDLQSHWAANYVLSVGNGVSSFEMPDVVMLPSNTYDYNDDRSWTARLGLIHLSEGRIELGFNAAMGALRNGALTGAPATDPRTLAADFSAYGVDLQVSHAAVGLRSYYYLSSEDLKGGPLNTLDRVGFTLEPSYRIPARMKFLKGITFVLRYSSAEEDQLDGTKKQWTQEGLGINLHLTKVMTARFGYIIQDEGKDNPEIKDDLFSASLTAEF